MNLREPAGAVIVAALALASAFGGCTGGGGNPNPGPSVACLVAQPLLVQAYPISGSTVPVATALFVFGIPQSATPSAYRLQLVANGQTRTGTALGAAPSPLPSPVATLPANYMYAGAIGPSLQAVTTYTVQLTQPITCLGPETTGTFSTQ